MADGITMVYSPIILGRPAVQRRALAPVSTDPPVLGEGSFCIDLMLNDVRRVLGVDEREWHGSSDDLRWSKPGGWFLRE